MAFDARLAGGMGVFAALVDTGSFVRAADALGLSQPGVSRAISRLEARLGVRLFDRTTRSVRLTDEGRLFHRHVAPLLAGMEEAAVQVGRSANTVGGRLRVNVDPYFSRLILAPHLGTFLERYSALQVELMTSDRLGDLVADGFDLAVRFGAPKDSSLHARKLLETRVLTVAAPAYFSRHGRPLAPGELERGGHRFILFRDSYTGKPFGWEFRKGRTVIELEPESALILNDAATMHSLCAAGWGIAQMFALGLESHLADGSLVNLFPTWTDERWVLYAFYPHGRLRPAKVAAFLDFISQLTGADSLQSQRRSRRGHD